MKCLAVQQPWAWAICAGFKRVENRTWRTPYRGPVAIVASGKRTGGNQAIAAFTGGRLPADLFAYGAIIGTAELTDVVPLSAAVEDDPHAYGPYCWLFEQQKLFESPLLTMPRLRLYDPKPDEAEWIAAEAAKSGQPVADLVYAAFARSLEDAPFDRALEQADHYRLSQRWSDLERVTARLQAIDPARREVYLFRAILAFVSERFAEALAECTRAVEIDPDWGLGYRLRCEVYAALDNEDAADADYDRAVELDPGLADHDDDDDEDTQDDES
jgi:tetratricopeptide (TPR) repeat protein